jgi:hypothetical protein
VFTDALNDRLRPGSIFSVPAACPPRKRTFRHAGIPTVRKINLRFRIGPTRWFDRRPLELAQMPPKPRESNKNYIGIVSEKTDEQRTIDSLASDRLTTKYLLDLVSAVFNRVADARK